MNIRLIEKCFKQSYSISLHDSSLKYLSNYPKNVNQEVFQMTLHTTTHEHRPYGENR